jgi:hypothetical protein
VFSFLFVVNESRRDNVNSMERGEDVVVSGIGLVNCFLPGGRQLVGGGGGLGGVYNEVSNCSYDSPYEAPKLRTLSLDSLTSLQ